MTALWGLAQEPLPGMPAKEAPGLVYFAWSAPYIKIGYTERELKRRGGELKVQMFLSVPGSRLDEKRLHRIYGSCRMGGGEWFWPDARLVADLFWLAGKQRNEKAYVVLRHIQAVSQWRAAG